MEQQYSTLELVRFDETARAPELQKYIVAAELDASVFAPQVVPDTTPQVFYDASSPEVHNNEKEKRVKDHAPSSHEIKPRLKWPWVVMPLFVAAAIAIGVGVGIWRHRDHKQSAPNITPSATPFILDDTSLAAVLLPDARHLFFQDLNGRIRRASRTTQSAQWTMSPDMGPGSDADFGAKNHTPLAAYSNISASYQIYLYYVSEGHVLNSSCYTRGNWDSDLDPSLTKYSTALNTRSLSVASTGTTSPLNASVNSTNLALLYYENPSGNVSALLQQGDRWVDITSQYSKSLPPEFRNSASLKTQGGYTLYESGNFGTLNTPFACGANWTSIGAIGAIFYSPNASISDSSSSIDLRFTGNDYRSGSGGPGTFAPFATNASSSTIGSIRDDGFVQQSDVALFGRAGAIWINLTQPVLEFTSGMRGPDSAFPFTRLASVTLADQSFTFLYHQINGTTFAEEQWDEEAHEWGITQYINLSDS